MSMNRWELGANRGRPQEGRAEMTHHNEGSSAVGTKKPRRNRRLWILLPLFLGAVGALVLVVLSGLYSSTVSSVLSIIVGIAILGGVAVFAGILGTAFMRRQDQLHTELRNLRHRLSEIQDRESEADDRAESERNLVNTKLLAVRKDVQVLRRRVPGGFLDEVESRTEALDEKVRETLRIAFESAVQLNRDPKTTISTVQATQLFDDYLSRGELLKLRPLIEHFGLLESQNLTDLRKIYRNYRRAGYWDLALRSIENVHAKTERDSDGWAVVKLRHEMELFARPTMVATELPGGTAYDPSGPILHMVGRVLPETQTGYTLRTQYTAMAQQRRGLPVAIVGQTGITSERSDSFIDYTFSGIDYYLLPGSSRSEVLLDEWLSENIERFADLVLRLRPSILHAHSDFFNALIVSAVGKRYGIPTVYESRGFWEESWLSRTVLAEGWDRNPEGLFAAYGHPTAYELRRDAEELARGLTDHVFTLAEVMRNHILAPGQLDPATVSIVPNAVEAAEFPVQKRDDRLADEIGLVVGIPTIGYISSMVEYEGIDTLIDAFNLVTSSLGREANLLLVGDGDHLPSLREKVESRSIENVVFTGRVPHERVLDYYGLIDLFVIPRKKSKVTDLVTPLKPFEAFSTGRAVIVSDVYALQEIAEQSAATETFGAGSATDLANKVVGLLDRPERRQELGSQGAKWVRNHRSWERNVNEYYRVYRELGYTGPVSEVVEAEIRLEALGSNPGEILDEMSRCDLPSLSGWFSVGSARQSATDVVEAGWKFENFAPIKVVELDDWSTYGRQNRSWGFSLHSWEFMDSLLEEFEQSMDPKWLRTGVGIAKGWIDRHRDDESADPMAWYDMSLALRTSRLLALALRAARQPEMRDDAIILTDALSRHLRELHHDKAFNPNNNHGFFTAASQVHAAKYAWMVPGASQAADEGMIRLSQMAETQFAPDGMHLEHSPEYHRMLLASFEKAVDDGLIVDSEIRRRVRRAAYALGWMVQPDGNLVQLGDTPEVGMVSTKAESIDEETLFVLSDGSQGLKPSSELAVFPEGGYAFVRSPRPAASGDLARGSYLAFSAAFHSRAHKHADDLNIVWFDRGQQILTDAGKFGYGNLLPADSLRRKQGFYYSDAQRQYVESTMAHNTLMMDGVDQDRRLREPYGSALGKCFSDNGIFDLSARVHHTDYVHRRRIVFRPGSELLVKDSVFSQSTETREGILWFNISGDFELIQADEDVVFSLATAGGELRLSITSQGRLMQPVRGETDPLRGWRSRLDRKLEPVWSLGFEVSIDTRASVDTRFKLELR